MGRWHTNFYNTVHRIDHYCRRNNYKHELHCLWIPKGLTMSKPTGTFHDALTGETIERELTDEEIAALPEPSDLPSVE
jgi:hypothetical protein